MTDDPKKTSREQNKALAKKIAREFFASTRCVGTREATRIAFKYGDWGTETEGGGMIEDSFRTAIFNIIDSIEREAEECQRNATAVQKIRSSL